MLDRSSSQAVNNLPAHRKILTSDNTHRRLTLRQREAITAFLFLLPSVIGFLVFMLGPLVGSIGISLVEWNIVRPPIWVGVQNYVALLQDAEFWRSLRATAIYTIGVVPVSIVLSLALALLLNQKIHGMSVYRTVYFIPVVTSMIAVALMWRWMYNPNVGIVNYTLGTVFDLLRLPLTPPDWLHSTVWAMPAIIIMSVWKGLGYNMVLYLAALQGIPRHLLEAAEIDGASAWQRFVHITLPLLSPTTFFVVIISLIASFQVFEQAYVMTQGGPARATVTTVYYIYERAFQWYQMGYGSAIAWVLFLIVMAVTLVQWKYQNRWVYYD